jgi:lipoprotein-anchoring transpeptidase ErfK/SrfK
VRHRRTRFHWSGGVLATLVACAFCAGIAVAVAHSARSNHFPSTSTPAGAAEVQESPSIERAALAKSVVYAPKAGMTGVALDMPVEVTAGSGELMSVQLSASNGTGVAGSLVSGSAWRSTGALAANTDYRIAASVTGPTGVTATSSSTFRTLNPSAIVTGSVFPNGLTVGVAQPIVVRFDHFISNPLSRAAVLSHFTITESKPVPGGWHWFNNKELHFRPQSFWPKGEQVTVTSNLDGWSAGDGLWGGGQVTAKFTIGDSHVSVANLATDVMTVTDNNKVIAIYPFSGGKATDPTMNGTHIVLDRESVVRMISSSNGIPVDSPDGYDELVYSDVHITDTGEYVHAAPWSVDSQGHENVSHGCINLSASDALKFFGFSRVGDVVMVTGGPRPPALGDHGVMDWDTAWNQWTPGPVNGIPVPHKPAVRHTGKSS